MDSMRYTVYIRQCLFCGAQCASFSLSIQMATCCAYIISSTILWNIGDGNNSWTAFVSIGFQFGFNSLIPSHSHTIWSCLRCPSSWADSLCTMRPPVSYNDEWMRFNIYIRAIVAPRDLCVECGVWPAGTPIISNHLMYMYKRCCVHT